MHPSPLVRFLPVLLFGLLTLWGCTPTPEEASTPATQNLATGSTDNVLTYQGEISGVWADAQARIRVFRGVPYARPPIASMRWRPPGTASARATTYKADTFKPACWQVPASDNFVWARGNFERSEDCLYLNIWARDDAANLPVMVWFHGGAHTGGMSHDRIFDGTEIARRDVVLVSVNYRLGPMGFLALPELAAESSQDSAGNYGLLDKIAALNWIGENVAQFGGDAENVTIFGQSAGSQSVCSLMASPLARGLFQRAIGQSAACVSPIPVADARGFARGSAMVRATGTEQTDLAALRAISPDTLLRAARDSGWANQSRITIDGWVLPAPPEEIYAAGQQAPVSLLAGTLANEGYKLLPIDESLDLSAVRTRIAPWAGNQTDALLTAYEVERDPPKAYQSLLTDLMMTYGARRWVQYQQRLQPDAHYLYFMDHAPPAFKLYRPDDPALELQGGPRTAGAYHSGDLAFVFGNTRKVGVGWKPQDHQLAQIMVGYWTNFARSGNPNGDGLPPWPAYDPAAHTTQRLNSNVQTINGAQRARLDLIEAALPLGG
ncbi:MAG: carboxylesterase family protein [Pseudomonadota bacterium]